jgi:hypothetical protein
MPPLPPDFGRQLVALIREHSQLQAEVRTLASILEYVEKEGHLPEEGWLATLKPMRETPACRNISEQSERLLLQIEQAADVREVEQILSTIPPSKYIN